jgi:DNA polymerase-3 subunit gamma/tau
MSLHTRYRPLSFDEVLGQDDTIASLKHVIKNKRAHGFIFVGPSGVGKTTLARILANHFAGGKATATNVEEINAATNSGADVMRDVISRSQYRAVGGSDTKTIILDEAHRLSAAAWTVLLKPIEEPPPHVYWCLCTTEPGKIPPTIQTRCLKYTLKPVKEELIYELLQAVAEEEGIETADGTIEEIAETAGGSPRQGLVFLEACAGCKTLAEAQAIMRSAAASKEAVDLARWLISGQGRTWAEAMRYVKAVEGADAESIRIVLVNYLSKVLEGTKDDRKARQLLGMLECFVTPYNASDKMAPLLHSLGLALNMDQ